MDAVLILEPKLSAGPPPVADAQGDSAAEFSESLAEIEAIETASDVVLDPADPMALPFAAMFPNLAFQFVCPPDAAALPDLAAGGLAGVSDADLSIAPQTGQENLSETGELAEPLLPNLPGAITEAPRAISEATRGGFADPPSPAPVVHGFVERPVGEAFEAIVQTASTGRFGNDDVKPATVIGLDLPAGSEILPTVDAPKSHPAVSIVAPHHNSETGQSGETAEPASQPDRARMPILAALAPELPPNVQSPPDPDSVNIKVLFPPSSQSAHDMRVTSALPTIEGDKHVDPKVKRRLPDFSVRPDYRAGFERRVNRAPEMVLLAQLDAATKTNEEAPKAEVESVIATGEAPVPTPTPMPDLGTESSGSGMPQPNVPPAAAPATDDPALTASRALEGPTEAASSGQGQSQAPAAHVRPDLISHQLAKVLLTTAEDRAELLLDPAELGRLRFEITHRGDAVQIILSAERPETADLLRRNADQLLGDLRDMGFSGSALSFGAWGKNQEKQTSQFDLDPNGDPVPQVAPAQTFHPLPPARNSLGGLDIRL